MKTDELRQETKELEADIKRLLNKFIQRNGECDFKINVEVGTVEIEGTAPYPSASVTVSITI
jgi:hypothetical protein